MCPLENYKAMLQASADFGYIDQNKKTASKMKIISLAYGNCQVEVKVPDSAEVLSSGSVEPLADPAQEISRSMKEPLGTEPLRRLAQGRRRAAIVVSDNTRPVPYRGKDGILAPLINVLKKTGVRDIKVIVACGAHLPLDEAELKRMLHPAAFQEGVEVINHVATDEAMLRHIGRTGRTPKVTVNRHYLDADLKILTGLVEPHFMAGFSGGRKAVCPGICGQSVTYGFHSASMLDAKESTSLVLEGNPCHEEALRIARMAGVDFIINVTLDNRKRITGVFAGELEKAHLEAVKHLRTFVKIPIDKLYDVVITQAGYVGVNHYQCAKAALEAARAVKPGGAIVLLASLTDPEPVGSENYKNLLRLLGRLGPAGFRRRILAEDWSFMPDQWQVQMWAKVFERLGSTKRFYTCAPALTYCSEDLLPETNVAGQTRPLASEDTIEFASRIVQQTIDRVTKQYTEKRILILPDGPYAVPVYQ